MSNPQNYEVEVITATDEDLFIARENAIKDSGFTLEELREQHEDNDHFDNFRARLAWMTISGVDKVLGPLP